MANKKITVDSADDSLTPEEEHAIEVKIDKMLDPRPEPDTPKPKQPEKKKSKPKDKNKPKDGVRVLVIKDSSDSVDLPPDLVPVAPEPVTEAKTAPPLAEDIAKNIDITSDEGDEPEVVSVDSTPTETAPAETEAGPEASETQSPDELAPEELPKSSLDAGIDTSDLESLPDESPEADTQPPEAEEQPANEDEPSEPEAAQEEPEPPEIPQPAEEPKMEPVQEPTKKYRPPDGPLQFKRAEPIPEPSGVAEVAEAKPDEPEAKEALAKAFGPKPKRSRKGGRKASWLLAFVLLLAIVAVIAIVPKLRAVALNLVHVRASLSVTVDDASTHLPLSGVNLQIGTQAVTTDANGHATLKNLTLGTRTLILQKDAFAPVSKPIVVAWKTLKLSDLTMEATGPHYTFSVTDYASNKPVPGLQATSGAARSQGDKPGHVVLVVDKSQVKSGSVSISAPGYRTIKMQLPSSPVKPVTVHLVSGVDDVYVLQQAGKYNVYKAAIDGQDAKQLLAGSGYETSQISLVASTDGSQTALVSTRDNQKDNAGYLLDTLTLINVGAASSLTIDHAQQIRIVGWFGNRLVYTALKADAASDDSARYQLFSYDTTAKKRTELDHANTFNDVMAANGKIYYGTANHISGGQSQLDVISPDGSNKQALLASEVTSIVRTSYTNMLFATASSWYSYKLGDAKAVTTNSGYNGDNRLYVDSPNGQRSVWVDTAKGKLMLYIKASDSEAVLASQADIAYPVRWLNNDTIIYRVSNSKETADYVTSPSDKDQQRITDVSDSSGIVLW